MLPLQYFLARRFYARAADRINDPPRALLTDVHELTARKKENSPLAMQRTTRSVYTTNNAAENQATRNGARGQLVQVTSLLSRAQTRDIT